MTQDKIRRLPGTVALTIVTSATVFPCSIQAGAEDPTGQNILIGFLFFLVAVGSIGAQAFLYRFRKGGNGCVFWTTVILGIPGLPVSGFAALVTGGTSCGYGTIMIGFYVMLFFLAALILQMFLWLRKASTKLN